MMKNIVYVADLGQDVDDFIAIEYLKRLNVLGCVVLDPYPEDEIGLKRLGVLEKKNIEVRRDVPVGTEYVFVGGALTAVSKYIENNGGIKLLAINGGFVGENIVLKEDELEKFRHKNYVRTFNFNLDVESTDKVLKSSKSQIENIVLVGKNVCHSKKNTRAGFWNEILPKEILEFMDMCRVRENKCQHDMLACHEGLSFISYSEKLERDSSNFLCKYADVYPVTESGLNGSMTKWGSTKCKAATSYRPVKSAVGFRKDFNKRRT